MLKIFTLLLILFLFLPVFTFAEIREGDSIYIEPTPVTAAGGRRVRFLITNPSFGNTFMFYHSHYPFNPPPYSFGVGITPTRLRVEVLAYSADNYFCNDYTYGVWHTLDIEWTDLSVFGAQVRARCGNQPWTPWLPVMATNPPNFKEIRFISWQPGNFYYLVGEIPQPAPVCPEHCQALPTGPCPPTHHEQHAPITGVGVCCCPGICPILCVRVELHQFCPSNRPRRIFHRGGWANLINNCCCPALPIIAPTIKIDSIVREGANYRLNYRFISPNQPNVATNITYTIEFRVHNQTDWQHIATKSYTIPPVPTGGHTIHYSYLISDHLFTLNEWNYIRVRANFPPYTVDPDTINFLHEPLPFTPPIIGFLPSWLTDPLVNAVRDIHGLFISYLRDIQKRFPFSWFYGVQQTIQQILYTDRPVIYPSLVLAIPEYNFSIDMFPIRDIVESRNLLGTGIAFGPVIEIFRSILSAVLYVSFAFVVVNRVRRFVNSLSMPA